MARISGKLMLTEQKYKKVLKRDNWMYSMQPAATTKQHTAFEVSMLSGPLWHIVLRST